MNSTVSPLAPPVSAVTSTVPTMGRITISATATSTTTLADNSTSFNLSPGLVNSKKAVKVGDSEEEQPVVEKVAEKRKSDDSETIEDAKRQRLLEGKI